MTVTAPTLPQCSGRPRIRHKMLEKIELAATSPVQLIG